MRLGSSGSFLTSLRFFQKSSLSQDITHRILVDVWGPIFFSLGFLSHPAILLIPCGYFFVEKNGSKANRRIQSRLLLKKKSRCPTKTGQFCEIWEPSLFRHLDGDPCSFQDEIQWPDFVPRYKRDHFLNTHPKDKDFLLGTKSFKIDPGKSCIVWNNWMITRYKRG